MNLGSRHLQTVPNLAASNFFGAAIFSDTKVNFDGSVIRARINFARWSSARQSAVNGSWAAMRWPAPT